MLLGAALSLLLQVSAADPIRTAETSEKMLKARPSQVEVEAKAKPQVRRFQEKFNALVKAIEAFGKKYNEGKGELWPKREADALRKAIAELEELPELQPFVEPE